MLKEFRLDLHIHTCLSPCADLTMAPTAIIERAKLRHLDIIGICDHNAAENVFSVREAGKRENIRVFAGMEISSSEEAHVLGFFEQDAGLRKMQETVYENLPGKNDEKKFGKQLILDEFDRPVDSNDRLLIGATSLPIGRIVDSIHAFGGIAIASHIDREAFGIIGQLGFIPKGLALDALEVSADCGPEKFEEYKKYGFPLVKFSDAHFLADIGKAATDCLLSGPSLPEFVLALKGIEGRKIIF